MPKIFSYTKPIYIKDVTIFGNVYFANYVLWTGEAREALLKTLIGDPKKFLQSGLKLVTIDLSVKFKGETNLMDVLKIDVIPKRITITTIELEFIFKNETSQATVATARQKLGFVGPSGHAVALPRELLASGRAYLDESLNSQVEKIEQKIMWIEQHSSLK